MTDEGLDLTAERTDDSLIGAERAVVGAMLLDGRRIPEVKAHIRATDFFDWRYSEITATLFELYQKERPTDVLAVGTRMRVKGRMRESLDEVLLHELMGEVPTASNAAYYAEIVAGGAARRRLRAAGLKLVGAADDPSVNVLHAIDEGRTLLDDALPGELEHKPIGAYTSEFVEAMMSGDVAPRTRTPWPDLDAVIQGGWKAGQLITIGARPATGKTVVGCQIAAVAAQYGDVLYFSGEMGRESIMIRMFAMLGGIPLSVLEKSNAGRFEDRMRQTAAMIDRLGFHLDERSTTWDEIETATWDLHRHGRLKMIVVDHLGLYGNGKGRLESRQAEVSEMTRRAKILAQRLGIVVVVLSQLNRESVKGGKPRRPGVSDLRESGSLEQDSDVVILLEQSTKLNRLTKQQESDGRLWLHVDKQRNGPTQSVETIFEGAYARASHIMHAR